MESLADPIRMEDPYRHSESHLPLRERAGKIAPGAGRDQIARYALRTGELWPTWLCGVIRALSPAGKLSLGLFLQCRRTSCVELIAAR